MSLQKLDETIRLLRMDVDDLNEKMAILFQTERLGSFGKVILLNNLRWTVVTSLPVYKTFELKHWEHYSETEFVMDKKVWNKADISTNRTNPTILGTMYNGTIQMYLDSKGYVNIKSSVAGYNVNTFISTIVT